VAVLAPIAWRTPPRHYGPWEQFASLLTEGLVAALAGDADEEGRRQLSTYIGSLFETLSRLGVIERA